MLVGCQDNKNHNHTSNENNLVEENTSLSIGDLEGNTNIKLGNLEEVTLFKDILCNGRIDIPPADLISIHSKTEGYIRSIYFLPGQFVNQGTTIATVEVPQLLEKQRLMLEMKADYLLAEKEYERKLALVTKEATSTKLFDEASARRDRLQASYLGLKNELSVLGIDTKKLEEANTFQSTILVTAPASGNISSIDVNKGQYISAQNRIAQLTSDHHLHLELNVYEKDAHLLKVGQKVSFSSNNSSSLYAAEIVHINPVVNATSGTIGVHCHFEMQPELRAGMYVNAHIKTGEAKEIALPIDATTLDGNKYFGYKQVNNQLIEVELKDAVKNGDWITSPSLTPMDTWLLKGAYYLGIEDTEAGHAH